MDLTNKNKCTHLLNKVNNDSTEGMPLCQELVNLYVVSAASENTFCKTIFLDIKSILVAFFVLNKIGFDYKNYSEFVFVLEFRNGGQGKGGGEGMFHIF